METKILIKSVHHRRILNSHGEFTNEFIIVLNNGSIGRGASPKGETISIYEDKHIDISPQKILDVLKKDIVLCEPMNQEDFDQKVKEVVNRKGGHKEKAADLASQFKKMMLDKIVTKS